MKTTIFIILTFLLLFSTELNAQDRSRKIKTYKVLVTTIDNSRIQGYLYSANTEGLLLSSKKSFDSKVLFLVKTNSIKNIKIGRKGQVGRGALIGGLSGVAIGVIGGLASGDDDPGWFSFTKEEKAQAGALVFGVLGAGIGAAAGSSRTKITVDGEQDKYNSQLHVIQSFTIASSMNN